MTKTEREMIKSLKAQLTEVETLKGSYKRKLDQALTRLSTIATGCHYPFEVQEKWSQETKLQVTAAKALEAIARIQ